MVNVSFNMMSLNTQYINAINYLLRENLEASSGLNSDYSGEEWSVNIKIISDL